VRVSVTGPDLLPRKDFTPDELLDLSERIYDLARDVSFFDFAAVCDCFPSPSRWHGPKPEGPILALVRFPPFKASFSRPQHLGSNLGLRGIRSCMVRAHGAGA
jgi:hypothetical protein